jgi:hypothetical protein
MNLAEATEAAVTLRRLSRADVSAVTPRELGDAGSSLLGRPSYCHLEPYAMPDSEGSQHLPCTFDIFSRKRIDELEGEGGVFDLDSLRGDHKPGMPARSSARPFRRSLLRNEQRQGQSVGEAYDSHLPRCHLRGAQMPALDSALKPSVSCALAGHRVMPLGRRLGGLYDRLPRSRVKRL